MKSQQRYATRKRTERPESPKGERGPDLVFMPIPISSAIPIPPAPGSVRKRGGGIFGPAATRCPSRSGTLARAHPLRQRSSFPTTFRRRWSPKVLRTGSKQIAHRRSAVHSFPSAVTSTRTSFKGRNPQMSRLPLPFPDRLGGPYLAKPGSDRPLPPARPQIRKDNSHLSATPPPPGP